MNCVLAWMTQRAWLGWLLTTPFFVVLALWAADRAPPFEVVAGTAHSVPVVAGDIVQITVSVQRDIARGCSTTFTRHIFSAAGYRFDMEGTQHASAEWLADLERRSPGQLRVLVKTPHGIGPGRAELITALRYVCNPLHRIWPIEVRTSIPFYIVETPK